MVQHVRKKMVNIRASVRQDLKEISVNHVSSNRLCWRYESRLRDL